MEDDDGGGGGGGGNKDEKDGESTVMDPIAIEEGDESMVEILLADLMVFLLRLSSEEIMAVAREVVAMEMKWLLQTVAKTSGR